MEATLREILDIMISKDAVVAGLVTDDMQLAKRLQKINQLAEYRLVSHKELLPKCRALMKRANATRAERNDLIHGQWRYNEPSLTKGIIVCVDHRWKHAPVTSGGGCWSSDGRRQYTFNELNERVQTVMKVVLNVTADASNSRHGLVALDRGD
jgi:hypothetical protein